MSKKLLILALLLTILTPNLSNAQESEGTLCVRVYGDLNRNNIYESETEDLVPDIEISIRHREQEIERFTTINVVTCVGDLSAGIYTFEILTPLNMIANTSQEVELELGQSETVEFGLPRLMIDNQQLNNGVISLSYPSGWVSQSSSEAVILGNRAFIEHAQHFEPGDFQIVLFPLDLSADFGGLDMQKADHQALYLGFYIGQALSGFDTTTPTIIGFRDISIGDHDGIAAGALAEIEYIFTYLEFDEDHGLLALAAATNDFAKWASTYFQILSTVEFQ